MIAGLGAAAQLVVDNINKYHDVMRDTRDYLETQLAVSECTKAFIVSLHTLSFLQFCESTVFSCPHT